MASSARIDELRKKFDENQRRYFAPLANEYRKAGDFDQAIFICQEYLPQQPGHMSGHIVLGQALFEAKRLPEARTVFETALTLDPENLIALRHLADISRELGEVSVARGWYERVLQADPRNEEIAAIMSSMGGGKATPQAAAPTADIPAIKSPDAPKPAPVSASAPTVVELSASAVQEMVRARQMSKGEAAPPKTLDEAPTVELTSPTVPEPMEGLEPTSHSAAAEPTAGSMLDIPAGGLLDNAADATSTFDVPSGGMLGLEPTSAASPAERAPDVPAAEGLDSLSLENFSVPAASAASPRASAAPSATTEPTDGLLDLDTFEIGGAKAPAADDKQAAPSAAPQSAADAPIDGGHEGAMDFDFELPAAPTPAAAAPSAPVSTPLDSVPTAVMDAIVDAVPTLVDAVQAAVPAIIDIAKGAIPSVVDAVKTGPTMIMDAVGPEAPRAELHKAALPAESAPTQQMDIASVMSRVKTPATAQKPAGEVPADRSPAFVTETMAQLYLEQGHREQAIDIYRQLVAAKPNDAELRGKLEAIERGALPTPTSTVDAAPAVASQASSPPAAQAPSRAAATRTFNRSGPSIRDVLRDLFGVDRPATNGNGAPASASGGELGSIDILFTAGSVPEELDALAAAFDGGYVAATGSIDDVFAGGAG
jgi:tetratricopeptide (TPR) repeat protein